MVIKNHLMELDTALASNNCNGCPNWATMNRQARLHEFIKNEHCQILIDQREGRKNKFNLRKKVCQSFGETVADKKLYAHNMKLGEEFDETSDNDNSNDSDDDE